MNYNNWIPNFQSKFKNELINYIEYKRANGCKYGQSICNMLLRLDNFFLTLNDSDLIINQEIVDKWMQTCDLKNKQVTKGRYFSTINCFCEYLRTLNYDDIIRPQPYKFIWHSNFIPYIFSSKEITRMIAILKDTLDENNIDSYSLYILICLYYCCGLRRMEALNLKLEDYNSVDKIITIKNGKNNTSRLIPINNYLNNLLKKYLTIRNSTSDYIFVDKYQRKFGEGKLYNRFKKLLNDANIPLTYEGKTQRLHDLRHTFAVHSLNQMEEKGFDLYTSLPILSTYLGHKSIVETEYYLKLIKSENENILNKSKDYTKNLYGKKDKFYEE